MVGCAPVGASREIVFYFFFTVKRTDRPRHPLAASSPNVMKEEYAKQTFPVALTVPCRTKEMRGSKTMPLAHAAGRIRVESGPGVSYLSRQRQSDPAKVISAAILLAGEGCSAHDIITGCCHSRGTSVHYVWGRGREGESRGRDADADSSICAGMPSCSRKHVGPQERK